MITVDKYVRKLLFEHDCVIIPEFGGLLTHHVGAHYDATNCVFLPARKRLAFNEVLKIDDGLLAYYVAAHEKLSREEAIIVVRRYVDSLRQDLLAGGTLEMDSIGEFSLNAEGKLVFEPDYSQNYNNEWFGMQSLAVREVIREEWGNEDININLFESERESISTGGFVTRRLNWLNWAAAAVFVGAVTLLSTLNSSPDSSSLLSTMNPFESVKDFTFDSYTPALTPSITSMSRALEPIAAPVEVFAYIPRNETLSTSQAPEIKVAPVEVVAYIPKNEVLEETVQRKSNPTGSRVKVETLKASSVLTAASAKEVKSTNRYFLIAGSFGSMKNAKDLKRQLNNEGFIESKIMDNSGGKLIKVSAGSYASMESAMHHKNKVDIATGADSWVYHRR